mmetsp:Transcript_14501/g.32944  ORF Transcript_14501/g.32944 Transcript_14501/m.32944 type:complete len:190 (+) Transcript_14501:83-652(+)
MARSNILSVCIVAVIVLYKALPAFVGCGQPVTQSAQLRANSIIARRAEEGKSITDRVQLKVLTPEGLSVESAVSEAILPSASGQLGVLANHAPMMTALDIGVLRYKKEGKWTPLVVNGGFANVDSNQLTLLVNEMETADEITVAEAQTGLEEATEALEKAESKSAKLEATTNVKKASARLQAAMFASKK